MPPMRPIQVHHGAAASSLDRLAQFFIAPLLQVGDLDAHCTHVQSVRPALAKT